MSRKKLISIEKNNYFMKFKIKVSKISLLIIFLFVTVTFNFSQAVKKIPKNWKTYSDSNISFRYPANFTLKKLKRE